MATPHHKANEAHDWAALIGAIAASQDRAAFAILFEHFAPRIKTFMYRSGLGNTHAEDLAQETMLTVWRKAALFNPSHIHVAAWIFTIARNLRIDAFRKQRRAGASEPEDIAAEFHLNDDEGPHEQAVAAQSERQIRVALAQLPDDQRQVVMLSYFHERAHADIANALNIPLGTVKSRLRLAMSKLRQLLDDVS